jgi:hypothetical protein
MAIIILTRPIEFPVATIRGLLTRNLPTMKWQVGEDDNGGWDDISNLLRPQLIIGREGAEVIFTNVQRTEAPLTSSDGLSEHIHHIIVAQPTTDDTVIAERIVASICAGLVMRQDSAALCQLTVDGPWLSTEQMERAMIAIEAGNALDSVFTEGEVPPAETGVPHDEYAEEPVLETPSISQDTPELPEFPELDLPTEDVQPSPPGAPVALSQPAVPARPIFGRKGL